jgi:hypothetical protein
MRVLVLASSQQDSSNREFRQSSCVAVVGVLTFFLRRFRLGSSFPGSEVFSDDSITRIFFFLQDNGFGPLAFFILTIRCFVAGFVSSFPGADAFGSAVVSSEW